VHEKGPDAVAQIPKVIHFCFGMRRDFGGRPFSFVHYLAVKSAFEVHRPEAIRLHYAYEPSGKWWRCAKKYLEARRVRCARTVFGKPLVHYAHRADVLRLDILSRQGGIYLDMDVVSLKPFTPLLRHECVMGRQGQRGLCNAVILAQPHCEFIRRWRSQYRDFDRTRWDFHSVILPKILWALAPRQVHVLGPRAFFYPLFWQPALLWSAQPADFSSSYCIHLWEETWWDRYLVSLTPQALARSRSGFARLVRRFL
jgi:hypothetical protein